MAIQPTDGLQCGQRVAADVLGLDRRVLLPAGTIIDQRHLMLLRAWGIPEIDVGEPTRQMTGVDPALVRQAEAEVRMVFRNLDLRDPFLKELARHCALRRLKQLMHGSGCAG